MHTNLRLAKQERPYTVLIIESDVRDLMVMKRQLGSMFPEIKTVTASSVGDAYKTFRQHPFDLILLDLNLPDSYGPNTVQEIRRFNRHVPIIAITGDIGSDLIVNEAIRKGANRVLFKSLITSEVFCDAIEEEIADYRKSGFIFPRT